MSRSFEEPEAESEAREFGPEGCSVVLGDGERCGEQETLRICRQFNEMYEAKMREIDAVGGGDCAEAKMRLQELWIKDLISQNEELISALERLEYECSQRVAMLEEKLTDSVKCGHQVLQKYSDLDLAVNISKSFQRLRLLESDLGNLLEFVRRVREERVWSVDGLSFYEVDCAELVGESRDFQNAPKTRVDLKIEEYTEELQKKDDIIKELRAEICDLKEKGVEEDFVALKKSMLDMRDALTAEVADKHDVICTLRRDIQLLEDQCRRADQQTHFKDDIIKELRKEIKYYKQKNKLLNFPTPYQSSLPKVPKDKYKSSGPGPSPWAGNGDNRNQTVIYMKEEEDKRRSNKALPTCAVNKAIKPRSKFTDTKKISMNYYEEVYEDYEVSNEKGASYVPKKKFTSSYLDDLYLSLSARRALCNFDEALKKKLLKTSNTMLNNSF